MMRMDHTPFHHKWKYRLRKNMMLQLQDRENLENCNEHIRNTADK